MTKLYLFLLLLVLPNRHTIRYLPFSAAGGSEQQQQQQEGKPNIVILFADNLGYNDISSFGGSATSVQTPNVDRLSLEGMKFNNWNSAAHLCSASRAALLTGKQPIRTGVYPRVFKPGAKYGLLPNETTLAEYLREEGYATSIVGKWHLGHREAYLPINQGFDEWFGIPYHMSGGSVDDNNHTCAFDVNQTMWLPLYQGLNITEQPVQLATLAKRYAEAAKSFLTKHAENARPFFLYMAFSHVHQLCAPNEGNEQKLCQWSALENNFDGAVQEMDWIVGHIVDALDELNVSENTLVLFTSDNGPWVAEQECSGKKGPFEGKWLQNNVDLNCTACPSNYHPSPQPDRPRRCTLQGKSSLLEVDGIHCGADTGLGSTWEANLRMPALIRWPGHILPNTETTSLVSTLDVVPTILSIIGKDIPLGLDGKDISHVLLEQQEKQTDEEERVLFFWRDGFREGPLPQPYGRFDVSAVKIGRIKAWLWTKSAHYNDDVEVYHDPPLLFDVLLDPAEAFPLEPSQYVGLIERIHILVQEHKDSVDWSYPLALETDPKYVPCVDHRTGCRSHGFLGASEKKMEDSM